MQTQEPILAGGGSQELITKEVVILGGRYTVKSGYSAAFVERTAALVNAKLSEIIRDGGVIATDKVAILACMNLASELLKLQEEQQSLKDRTKRRLEKLLSGLDICLSQEELSYVHRPEKGVTGF